MKYEGYAVNTWALPKKAIEDIKKWLSGKEKFVNLLDKYNAFDSGMTFKNFQKVVDGLKKEGYKLKIAKDENYIYSKGESIIIVERYVSTDYDVWKEANES